MSTGQPASPKKRNGAKCVSTTCYTAPLCVLHDQEESCPHSDFRHHSGRPHMALNHRHVNHNEETMANTHRRGASATHAPRQRLQAANDNQPDRIEELRKRGYSLRVIAAELGISVGKVCRALYATKPQPANDNTSVVRFVTTLGIGGSRTCMRVPIRMPRVQIIAGVAA